MPNLAEYVGYHDKALATVVTKLATGHTDTQFTYKFHNFFHPWVGELIAKLNRDSLPGLLAGQLDPAFIQPFFEALYQPSKTDLVQVQSFPKQIDVDSAGPY